MIISNPVIRFVRRAVSACGLIDGLGDSSASRGKRIEPRDSPFVLVAYAPDGRWGVFQQDFEKPHALFDKLQEACDYANELAKTRTDSMVLIGNRRGSAANADLSIVAGAI